MTTTNTDLTEEDAADLQFPKVHGTSVNIKNSQFNSLNTTCLCCKNELTSPYIVCAICNINICSVCFAKGKEFLSHKNDHDYSIFNDTFTLFDGSNWTAREELVLLNTLLDYSNFSLVAKDLQNRTVKEVKEHYDDFYLQKKGSELLPSFSIIDRANINPIVPYRFKLVDVHEPPRYNYNSVGFHSMAGYNAPRSDFELEYDSNAEDLISGLNLKDIGRSDPHYKLITDLQCAILRSYNRRLAERERRKLIIRNHGLILIRKTIGWLHRYDASITKRTYERFCRFMQFCSGMQFEFLLEGLHRVGELKAEISRLCEYHKKGIRTIPSAQLYLRLKQQNETLTNDIKSFQNSLQFNFKIKHSLASAAASPNVKKRGVYSPLEIVGLPGYEKLTPKEQELCRTVRLVPLSYMEFRHILVNESRKVGHLKLQTARRLLKIDVNKTRRLYDFLVAEGYINNYKGTIIYRIKCFCDLLEFENAETLLVSEVHMLLEHRKAQNESAEDEQEFSDVFMKTLTYTDRFRKFKNKETISAVRNLLMQKKLHKFELAALANLCPETTEEAKSLIPSLEGRFEDEDLQAVLDDIQTKRKEWNVDSSANWLLLLLDEENKVHGDDPTEKPAEIKKQKIGNERRTTLRKATNENFEDYAKLRKERQARKER
ncbi:hypothetical protein FQA39_LY11032 [Lamprigera yunnana]|nr:hypothetical protein FQA39_LY11032 [Lamprigera yunnana]